MTGDPLVGRRLANFQIERLIGRGGMPQVYYGRDVKLKRPVAIKVVDVHYRWNTPISFDCTAFS
jgi:serine/threonine protein kinase